MVRSALVRSAVRISGVMSGCIFAYSSRVKTRTTSPGPSRPARPARWSALVFASETVTRPVMPRLSRLGTLDSPASTTLRTPGTVIDDSATDVATTTRLSPLKASSCSLLVWRPWSGFASSRNPHTRSTSRTPGTNTSVRCSLVVCAAT